MSRRNRMWFLGATAGRYSANRAIGPVRCTTPRLKRSMRAGELLRGSTLSCSSTGPTGRSVIATVLGTTPVRSATRALVAAAEDGLPDSWGGPSSLYPIAPYEVPRGM